MRWIVSVIIVCIVGSVLAPSAHAIIFLPAIILIPIAKIIAVLIGGFSVPALGIGAAWSKLFRKSLKRTISVIVIFLLLFYVVLAVVLKVITPDRPLF